MPNISTDTNCDKHYKQVLQLVWWIPLGTLIFQQWHNLTGFKMYNYSCFLNWYFIEILLLLGITRTWFIWRNSMTEKRILWFVPKRSKKTFHDLHSRRKRTKKALIFKIGLGEQLIYKQTKMTGVQRNFSTQS